MSEHSVEETAQERSELITVAVVIFMETGSVEQGAG